MSIFVKFAGVHFEKKNEKALLFGGGGRGSFWINCLLFNSEKRFQSDKRLSLAMVSISMRTSYYFLKLRLFDQNSLLTF